MKAIHWAALLATLYFAVVGVNEFLPTGTVSALDGLPDAGSVFTSSSSTTGSNTIAGLVDVGIAAGLYFLVLHKKLMTA
jgi:hypothetical protein